MPDRSGFGWFRYPHCAGAVPPRFLVGPGRRARDHAGAGADGRSGGAGWFDLEDPAGHGAGWLAAGAGRLPGLVVTDEAACARAVQGAAGAHRSPNGPIGPDRSAALPLLGSASPTLLRGPATSATALAASRSSRSAASPPTAKAGRRHGLGPVVAGGFFLFVPGRQRCRNAWRREFIRTAWSSATCRNWHECAQPVHLPVLKPCWPITTGRSGMPPIPAARWASTVPSGAMLPIGRTRPIQQGNRGPGLPTTTYKRQVKPGVPCAFNTHCRTSCQHADADAPQRHPALGPGRAGNWYAAHAQPDQAYFWATHAGAELTHAQDGGAWCVGVEFKRAMRQLSDALQRTWCCRPCSRDALYVVYPVAAQWRYHWPSVEVASGGAAGACRQRRRLTQPFAPAVAASAPGEVTTHHWSSTYRRPRRRSARPTRHRWLRTQAQEAQARRRSG